MSQSHELPTGPLPERAALKESVTKIFKEVGPENLTRRALRARLNGEFKIDFGAHKELLDELVMDIVKEPAVQQVVAKAAKKEKESTLKTRKVKDTPVKGAKKARAEKDPNEPKGPQTAFFLFSAEVRPKVAAETPKEEGGIAAVATKIGALWKALSDEEKSKYQDLAVKDRERFERQKADFVAGGGQMSGRAKKEKKDPKEKGPKRPQNSLFLYMNWRRDAFKAEHPDVTGLGPVAKAISAEYKELPDSAKKQWEDKARADKQRYVKECQEQGIKVSAAVLASLDKTDADAVAPASSSDDDDE